MTKITKDTTLSNILKKPKAQDVLTKYNVPCVTCAFARMEMDKLKIGQICEMYGLDLEGLLKGLNKLK